MNGTMGVFGMDVIVDPHLPMTPSDGENARRIVRHGMADILRWLGQDVGPKPDEAANCIAAVDPVTRPNGVLFVSRELYTTLRLSVDPLTGRPVERLGRDALEEVWRTYHDHQARQQPRRWLW